MSLAMRVALDVDVVVAVEVRIIVVVQQWMAMMQRTPPCMNMGFFIFIF